MSKITLPDGYRYQYRCWLFAGYWKHSYEVIGRWGGMHFHVTEHDGHGRSAGLEIHYRQPPSHLNDRAPSQDACWLLKAPCWHDGTTLYAEEHFLPHFNGKDHHLLFRMLAKEAEERFEMAGFLPSSEEQEDTP